MPRKRNAEPLEATIQERKAPSRGDGKSNRFLLASPRGSCHLVENNIVLWTLETDGLLKLASHADGVDDFADLREEDHKIRLTHHIGPEIKKLVPSDTKDSIKGYFDEHYGKVGTDVFRHERVFLVAYEDGQIRHEYDPEIENGKIKNIEKLMIIKRVDYYVHRSEPIWSVKFAMIEASFPASWTVGGESVRGECAVYHAVDDKSFFEIVTKRKISLLPTKGNFLNQLLEDSFELLEEKERLVEMQASVEYLEEQVKKNLRITRGDLFKEDKEKGIYFYKGKYDHLSATIQVVSVSNVDIDMNVQILRETNYHPNVSVFYGWEAHDDEYWFAFEEEGISLAEYVVEAMNAYKEMSSDSLKILRGLVSAVHHLHSRNLFHEEFSLDNIFVSDKHAIKIGGLLDINRMTENSNLAGNLHSLAHIILFYMSNGTHVIQKQLNGLREKDIGNLKIAGTNEEMWDVFRRLGVLAQGKGPRVLTKPQLQAGQLLKHLAFRPSIDRLRLVQYLVGYIEDGNNSTLETAVNQLLVYNGGRDWTSLFPADVVAAMEKVNGRQLKSYTTTEPFQLIKFMRNAIIHIDSFAQRTVGNTGRTLADDLGSDESQLENTFRTRSPKIFLQICEVLKQNQNLPLPVKLQQYII